MPPRRSGHRPHEQRHGPHLEGVKRTRLVKKNFVAKVRHAPDRKPPHHRTDDRSDPDHDCLNVITGDVLSAAAPALAM